MQNFKGFIGPSYTLRNYKYDCQRTVNLHMMVDETGAGANGEPVSFNRTEGSVLLSSNASTGLGLYQASWGTVYAFHQNGLYSVASNGTETLIASWTTTGTWCRCVDNSISLFIIGDGWGYTYNHNAALLTAITSFNPSSVTYYDGYVICSEKDTNKFWHTELYSDTFPALNFYSAEANPDNIVAVLNNNEDLWIFGDTTTELWYDAGQGNVIFARRQGTLIETGCASAATIAKIDANRFCWLANDSRGRLSVVIANGYQAQKVSTFMVDEQLAQGDWANATAYSYANEGKMFYVLQVPNLSSTWVFDVTTSDQLGKSVWFERQTYTQNTGQMVQHLAQIIIPAYGGYFGISSDGKIYSYSYDFYDDNGVPIKRIRTTPHITNLGGRLFYNALELYLKTGVGSYTSNPTVMLEISKDGGVTWSNQIERQTGLLGGYNQRVIFRQLGMGRDVVFRITMADAVDWAIIGAGIDLSGENS